MKTLYGFKVGDEVLFGRERGEKTRAKITKLNLKSAKLIILEDRKGYKAGTPWGCSYGLMTHADGRTADMPAAVNTPLEYNPFSTDNDLLEALFGCYIALSPENLYCDGEASRSHVRATVSEMNRKIRGLHIALNRSYTESDMYAWYESKRKYNVTAPKKAG